MMICTKLDSINLQLIIENDLLQSGLCFSYILTTFTAEGPKQDAKKVI